MSWKNLHFRPPILGTELALDGAVSSDLLLIRYEGRPYTTFAGYIVLRESDPSTYHICGRGYPEAEAIDNLIEWMEVPE